MKSSESLNKRKDSFHRGSSFLSVFIRKCLQCQICRWPEKPQLEYINTHFSPCPAQGCKANCTSGKSNGTVHSQQLPCSNRSALVKYSSHCPLCIYNNSRNSHLNQQLMGYLESLWGKELYFHNSHPQLCCLEFTWTPRSSPRIPGFCLSQMY